MRVREDRWRDADPDSKQPGVALGLAVPRNAAVAVPRATADPGEDVPLRARGTP